VISLAGGYETVAFCEIDTYARKVLAKNWPGVPIFEDVTKLKGSDIGAVDVITGGFPCQDLSARQAVARDLATALDRVFSARCYDWLAKYGKSKGDCHISSLRMSQGFCPVLRKIRANGLANFSGPWPKSGMMQNGFVYPLPALARRMNGSGSVLLPTPTKHLSKEGGFPGEYMRNTPLLTAQIVGGGLGFPNANFIEWMMGFPRDHTLPETD
jgi:hypothetical protein